MADVQSKHPTTEMMPSAEQPDAARPEPGPVQPGSPTTNGHASPGPADASPTHNTINEIEQPLEASNENEGGNTDQDLDQRIPTGTNSSVASVKEDNVIDSEPQTPTPETNHSDIMLAGAPVEAEPGSNGSEVPNQPEKAVAEQHPKPEPLTETVESVTENTSSAVVPAITRPDADEPPTKKQKQLQLNFTSLDGATSLGLRPKQPKPEPVFIEDPVARPARKTPRRKVTTKAPAKALPKASPKAKSLIVAISPAQGARIVSGLLKPTAKAAAKAASLKLRNAASRTTIVREKSKCQLANHGLMVPLTYDLYDGNLLALQSNTAVALLPLTLGYPVQRVPYLHDVVYIMCFLSKFRDVVHTKPLGPADIERGLGLEPVSDTKETEAEPSIAYSRLRDRLKRQDYAAPVSDAMDELFRKLLALVLNRKKPIARDGQRSAIQELKAKYVSYGLPAEWRDDSTVHNKSVTRCEPITDLVDSSRPLIAVDQIVEYEGPQELMNPFHDKNFETYGLRGIESPQDRCVMLRCLIVWSLSVSTALKSHIVTLVGKQEAPGERDTAYASRAILKGLGQTMELKKEMDLKRAKKQKQKVPQPEFVPQLHDPTADPLLHPLALRLNEFVVGDCGFHIGRFYLVRYADAESGRVSSTDQMRHLAKDFAGVRASQPSSFKLYVEDTHMLLLESLAAAGLEFDIKGKEVENTTEVDESKYWHTVASDCGELQEFLEFLARKLGLHSKEEAVVVPSNIAYKPLLHMYQYLTHIMPLLTEYEELNSRTSSGSRTSRRKKVNYAATYDDDYEERRDEDDDYSGEDRDDDEEEEAVDEEEEEEEDEEEYDE